MPKVLVTGANRGIGLEFARQYAADGWDVVATSRQASSELDGLGVQVEQIDMCELAAVAAFGARIDGELDVLIANAGTDFPKRGETAEDAEAWVDMLAVNSVAPFVLAQALLPRMAAGGKLVAISSRMGSIADNRSGGWIPYRSSKAALNAAWHSLAKEVAPRGLAAVSTTRAGCRRGWAGRARRLPTRTASPRFAATSRGWGRRIRAGSSSGTAPRSPGSRSRCVSAAERSFSLR